MNSEATEQVADLVRLEWKLDIGQAGTDSDEHNPFRRSVKRLFATGKPFSRIALSFLRDGDGPAHWFGSFVQGKRTMFFPGFSARFDGVEIPKGPGETMRQSFLFDHLSLEENRKRWHITAEDSSDHIGAPQTLDLGEGRVLWFGLSFSSLSVFRPVYQTTSIEFTSPPGDSKRRIQAFRAAREGVDFPIISLNGDHPNSFLELFFHIAVIAGPPGFPLYTGPEMAFPFGNPHLRTALPSEFSSLPVRTHRLVLSEQTELQITATRLPGSLATPAIFTATPQATAIGGGFISS